MSDIHLEDVRRALLSLDLGIDELLRSLAHDYSNNETDTILQRIVQCLGEFAKENYATVIEDLWEFIAEEFESQLSSYYVVAHVLVARAHSQLGQPQDALAVLDGLLSSSPLLIARERMAIAYWKGLSLRILRRFPEAMSALSIGYSAAQDLEDLASEAMIYSEMASVNAATGDLAKSIAMYEKNLLTLSKLPGRERRILEDRINLASMYQGVGRSEDALKEYVILAKDAIVISRPSLQLVVMLNTAIAQKRLELNDDALHSYKLVFNLAQAVHNVEFQIRALVGMADLHLNRNELPRARALAEEALSLVPTLTGCPLDIEVQGMLASIDHAEGHKSEAIDRLFGLFNALIDIADNISAIIYGTDLIAWLAEDERYEEAYQVQDKCSKLQKAIYDREIERTAELTIVRSRLDHERESIKQRDEERNKILHAVVPRNIAERLMAGEIRIADHVADVTILFIDIVGFTKYASTQEPEELVRWLEKLFTALDHVFARFGCERVKTIGDSYMAICGTSDLLPDHTERMTRAALEIMNSNVDLPIEPSRLRAGINCGPVIAGVMGGSRLSFDVWGDTVNVAARMEEHSLPGRVHCSENVVVKLALLPEFNLETREPINIRGKGLMTTYWVSTSQF